MLISFFVTSAILIEVLTGIVKTTLSSLSLKLPAWADQLISLVLSTGFSIAGKIDFFAVVSEAAGMEFDFPLAFGIAISSLVLSRGSNAVHDILKALNPPVGSERLW